MLGSPIPFRPFDPRAPYAISHSNKLPHWRQRGCTYFVTFRLKDSLPSSAVQHLQQCRDHWLKQNGLDPNAADFKRLLQNIDAKQRESFERHYATLLNRYLDSGYGQCVLRSEEAGHIVTECLTRFDGQRFWLGDHVIMPNHIHALITPIGDHDLTTLVAKIKGTTARRINQSTGASGALWMKDSFDHLVRTWERLQKFQRYIADNPTKANLTLPAGFHRQAIYATATE